MTLLSTAPQPTGTTRSDAVREIGVFLGTTFALTAVSTAVAVSEGVDITHIDDASALGQAAMYGQAFYPLLGTVLARLTTPRDRRIPWGFRRPTVRTLALGWALGVGYPIVAFAIVLASGLAGFDADGLGPMVPLGLTVLVLPYVLLALGEDVGWRGLMVTRLAQVSGPRTVVVFSGVVWGMFHWPLMLFVGGAAEGVPTWISLACFTLLTVAYGAVLANMQLRWGLWPGVVMHAAGNAALYLAIEPLTAEKAHSGYVAGETGVVGALVMVVVALVWWRVAPLVRTPEGSTAPGRA